MSKDKDEPNFEHPSQEDNFMDILLGDQKDDLIEDCECKHQGSTGVGMDYHPEVMREELDELKLDIRINEEQYYQLPEKPFLQPNEEDNILLQNSSSKRTFNSSKISPLHRVSYSQETREMKIQRYRDKKSRRIWIRKIFYDCRKIVADKRMRINGRFMKKVEGERQQERNTNNLMLDLSDGQKIDNFIT